MKTGTIVYYAAIRIYLNHKISFKFVTAGTVLIFSFDDAADEKCKENLDAAIEANPSNPEAHQLMASFWLSKEDKEV